METDVESLPPPAPDPAPRSCSCRRCSAAAAWPRSVKRRVDKAGEGAEDGGGCGMYPDWAARVDVEVEAAALREALAGHQQTVAELSTELEEERAASASAASEAMAMILRLQREKAEVQMEARQFKRFAEEKMAHDQQELLILEDLVYKREQALQALTCEIRAYRHRLLSYGIDPNSLAPFDGDVDGESPGTPMYDYPAYDYPSLRCYDNMDCGGVENDTDLDKYPAENAETPRRKDHLRSLERRIHQLERTPSQVSLVSEMEKGVVTGHSPRGRARHVRHLSTDTLGSPLARVLTLNGKQQEEFPVAIDGSSSFGGDEDDDTCDRVYTVDAIHCGPPTVRMCEDYVLSPRISVCRVAAAEDADIKKLYARLQALEADRESTRQVIMSMQTDKAQLVLLKEIAQHLYNKDPSPPPPPPTGRKLVKKPSFFSRLSFVSMVKDDLSCENFGRLN
ncbi:hypothetical protein Taro_022048 [Colocasia esculenta]|uniref:GTD-binding domain-containing protein n=1 Tax=Colocasia esculenta TaxID=4460 RepID=A0A843V6S7_COLES|nr:hypothetical protein [Colocasia esculenta]